MSNRTQPDIASQSSEHDLPFPRRFWIYQRERFPFAQHGLLIVVFTFSAASYSRVCRGDDGFIPIVEFIAGAVTSILFFFLLRLADEFKDAEDDARWRPYRPVPRGLISFTELRWIVAATIAIGIMLNAVLMPRMLIPYAIVLGFMALMWREFFVPEWLKRHALAYMLSHMIVMPLIDFYTTGLDWLQALADPPSGLEYFLVVTFLNGIVIEVGRKVRSPQMEEEGVETYSALYGPRRAMLGWILVVLTTCAVAMLAGAHVGFELPGYLVLLAFALLCITPALLFLRDMSQRHARFVETAAGLWTIAMYLTLGAVPMVTGVVGG